MEYKDIEEVNKHIKPTNIKGKDYAEVNQRITAFRKLYPEGFIWTEMAEKHEDTVVFTAYAGYFKDTEDGMFPVVLGVGHAHERENANPINQTSHLEVAETSAVGRALGMMGLGVASALASVEEVVQAQQVQKTPGATKQQIALLDKLYEGEKKVKALQKFNVLSFNKLTISQASQLISEAKK